MVKSPEESVRAFASKGSSNYCNIFKIDNFKKLWASGMEECESSVFDISGYKWKLIVYPNGNKKDKVKGYVSMYLEIQDSGDLPSNWQVKVHVNLFTLHPTYCDVIHKSGGTVVFSASNVRFGLPWFYNHCYLFAEHGSEYLVNDCVLFGVEIKDLQGATAESFTMIEKPPNNRFTFKMKFSAVSRHSRYPSDEFVVGNRKWRIIVYPKGCTVGDENWLSVALKGEGYVQNAPKATVYTNFKLRVFDQRNGKHLERNVDHAFPANPSEFGVPFLLRLQDLRDPSKGFLVDDTLYVGVEMLSISTTSKFL